jgi:prepilin-type N-terminal cleavage/methylation domain-containing protein
LFSYSRQGVSVGPEGRTARMLDQIRRHSVDDRGFTLPELLVVILIIGILAVIVIPSFLTQRSKAVDVSAKALVRTADTAAEMIATDHNGDYKTVTTAEVNKYEPSIHIAASTSETYLNEASGSETGYVVAARADDGNEFKITRTATGAVTRQCVSRISKTGCAGSATSSW